MSLVNISTQRVKFISYTGEYPNLCDGELTLEIDGVEHRFGHSSGQYRNFWCSGGECGFNGDYDNPYTCSGAWEIEESMLPEELKHYAAEIAEVFNDNVEYGCCGHCIYIGEGDFICDDTDGTPIVVVEDWQPNENAGHCERRW